MRSRIADNGEARSTLNAGKAVASLAIDSATLSTLYAATAHGVSNHTLVITSC